MNLLRRRVSAAGKIFDTILYADGTLAIHVDPDHRAALIAAHGAETEVYSNFKGNTSRPPWYSKVSSIIHAFVDTEFKPTSMSY